MSKITIKGIGSILVDANAGTLRPSSHVVGQRLGVGFGFGEAHKMEVARTRRDEIKAEATKQQGEPEFGWRWLDHNGDSVDA